MLVRVELRDDKGQPDRNVWNAQATLSEESDTVTLSTNRVLLRNGLGTALVTPSGSGDFTLRAELGGLQAERLIQDRSSEPVTRVSGTLAGTETTWAGVILITNDTTVPTGHTLSIESNTLVLVSGVASGTIAPDLLVSGSIQCLGAEAHPITITCASPGLRWGQIRHNNAQPSLYRYTTITRAGRASGEGHTGQAPVIRPTNSRIVFEHCTISDHAERPSGMPGKIMQASGSDLVFDDTVLARARMGPEIAGTSLLLTNSYILEMHGPDDADGIYIHDAGGRVANLVDSVIADGDDDGIDTLSSLVDVERCIIRDWLNPAEDAKGISAFNRTVTVRRSLIVDCWVAISAKWSSGSPATVFIHESTLAGVSNTVAANYKANAVGPFVDFRITNSIMVGPDPIKSDFGTTNFTIGFCLADEPWDGDGNVVANPRFVDAANHDYHLQVGSPCIDAGDPASPLDADGSRIDIGCFTFQVPSPALSPPELLAGEGFQFMFSGYTNRNYAIEISTNAQKWDIFTLITHTNEPRMIRDPAVSTNGLRLYRARLAE